MKKRKEQERKRGKWETKRKILKRDKYRQNKLKIEERKSRRRDCKDN